MKDLFAGLLLCLSVAGLGAATLQPTLASGSGAQQDREASSGDALDANAADAERAPQLLDDSGSEDGSGSGSEDDSGSGSEDGSEDGSGSGSGSGSEGD